MNAGLTTTEASAGTVTGTARDLVAASISDNTRLVHVGALRRLVAAVKFRAKLTGRPSPVGEGAFSDTFALNSPV